MWYLMLKLGCGDETGETAVVVNSYLWAGWKLHGSPMVEDGVYSQAIIWEGSGNAPRPLKSGVVRRLLQEWEDEEL